MIIVIIIVIIITKIIQRGHNLHCTHSNACNISLTIFIWNTNTTVDIYIVFVKKTIKSAELVQKPHNHLKCHYNK